MDFVHTLIELGFHRQPQFTCAFAKKYYDCALFVEIDSVKGLKAKLLFKKYNIEIPKIEDEDWIIDFDRLNK